VHWNEVVVSERVRPQPELWAIIFGDYVHPRKSSSRIWRNEFENQRGESADAHIPYKEGLRTPEPEKWEMDATATATAISTTDDDEVAAAVAVAASLRGKKVAMEKI